jgi:putative hydrolase of the HAD superfamily
VGKEGVHLGTLGSRVYPTETKAVTFDWYGTLAHHREQIGRSKSFVRYLASQGLPSDPWNPQIMFDVFDYYADAYRRTTSPDEQRTFWTEFAGRLFQKANVRCDPDEVPAHVDAIRNLFGPRCFQLFPEVEQVLSRLKRRGLKLAIISNWQRGLDIFCHELRIAPYFEAIISSADVGFDKPDPRIFAETLRRLRVAPEYAVHVGDLVDDDVKGATEAGLRAVLVDRSNARPDFADSRIRDLSEVERFLD